MSHTVLCILRTRRRHVVRVRVDAPTPAAAMERAAAWCDEHKFAAVGYGHPAPPGPGITAVAVVELTPGGPVDVDLTAP
jgi:hypothetical protein